MTSGNSQLTRAVQLVKSGYKTEALNILVDIIRVDSHNEIAWAWFIQALPDDQKAAAAKMFLQENPTSEVARLAVDAVGGTDRAESQSPRIVDTPNLKSLSVPDAGEEPLIFPSIFEEETSPRMEQILAGSEVGTEQSPDALSGTLIAEEVHNPELLTAEDIRRSVTGRPDLPAKILLPKPGIQSKQPMTAVLIGVGGIMLVILAVIIYNWIFNRRQTTDAQLTQTAARVEADIKTRQPQITSTTVEIVFTPTVTSIPRPTAAEYTPTPALATPESKILIEPDNVTGLKWVSSGQAPVFRASISPNLAYLVPLDGSSQVRLLDYSTYAPVFNVSLPSDSMVAAVFSQDETRLAAAINLGDVVIYSIPGGELISTLTAGELKLSTTTYMAFSQDGQLLMAVSGSSYTVWDVGSSVVVSQGVLPEASRVAGQVVIQVYLFKYVFFTHCAADVCALALGSGDELKRYAGLPDNSLPQFTLSPDGAQVAVQTSGSAAKYGVTFYQSETGNAQGMIELGLTELWGMTYSPDGKILAAWGPLGTNNRYGLIFLDTQNLVLLSSYEVGDIPSQISVVHRFALSFSTDGGMLVAVLPPTVMVFAVQ
jgi:WD40 repeat protein